MDALIATYDVNCDSLGNPIGVTKIYLSDDEQHPTWSIPLKSGATFLDAKELIKKMMED